MGIQNFNPSTNDYVFSKTEAFVNGYVKYLCFISNPLSKRNSGINNNNDGQRMNGQILSKQNLQTKFAREMPRGKDAKGIFSEKNVE